LASGAIIGGITARLAWGPTVYNAIARAAALDGVAAPRHLPGWPPLAILAVLSGAAANDVSGVYFAAIPAALLVASLLALWWLVPARIRHARRQRAERDVLRRELE
jgi:TRAP-type C4-dicarboxylate transport system permease large subunit